MGAEYIIYIVIPFVSAMIGWGTNYIAVKMIFRPHNPVNVLGFRIQGLIPRRQGDLAQSLGDTIERELISHQDIKKVLDSAEMHESISTMIETQIDTFIKEKLGSNPMISMFLQGELLAQVKSMFQSQFEKAIPEFLETCMTHVENKLDFKEIVREKVENFDYVKLEEIVFRIAAKELKTIEILGGVFGFLIGLAQVVLLVLSRN